MIRLNSKSIKAFLLEYEPQVLQKILGHIPSLVLEETDDKTALIKRILFSAITSRDFQRIFSHRTDSLDVDDSDIEALVNHLLIIAHEITLKKPLKEPHMMITKNGDFHKINIDVKQVEIHWIINERQEIQCEMLFPDGSKEIVDDAVIDE